MQNKTTKDKIKTSIVVLTWLVIGAGTAVYLQTKAGSLTPPGSPAATMYSLSDIAGSGFSSVSHSLVQIKNNIDNAYSACFNLEGYRTTPVNTWTCTNAPACPSGWTEVTTYTSSFGDYGGLCTWTNRICCLPR
mgnify:CR=1